MNKFGIFLCALASSAITSEVWAEDKAAEEKKKALNLEVELGILQTSGNTETTSLLSKFNAKHELEHWRNQYVLEGLYKRDEVEIVQDDETITESKTSAQKFFASTQADYKLNEENRGLFIFGSYEKDRFSGYQYQGTLAGGYSDRLFSTENSHFDYSVGPGISFAKTEETENDSGEIIPSEETQNGVVRLAASYLYNISDNAKFTQTVSSDVGVEQGENTKTTAETAITANINHSLALKASYTLNHNTHVPDDKKHADTQTAVTLVYSYK